MPGRFGLTAILLLVIAQPLASLGTGDAPGALSGHPDAGSPPGTGPGRIDAPAPAGVPLAAPVRAFPLAPYMHPSAVPASFWPGLASREPSTAVPATPACHRGELAPGALAPPGSLPFPARGPDTPPPEDGDWTISGSGNRVNDTVILLNGSLDVAGGDLTLENVSLVMNCTWDGEHGIYVGEGGTLNLENCTVTAFNGSLHYRFIVRGSLLLDRCDVSEVWGDLLDWERSGLALHTSSADIRSSVVRDGETCGIQVFGAAGPSITGTTVRGHPTAGVFLFDNATPRISGCVLTQNNWSGLMAAYNSSPVVEGCTFEDNRMHGVQVEDTASPLFHGCEFVSNDLNGLAVAGCSTAVISECNASGNGWNGFRVEGESCPELLDCTAEGNGWNGASLEDDTNSSLEDCVLRDNRRNGVTVNGTSTSRLTSCLAAGNTGHGFQVLDRARPVLVDCTATGNVWSGLEIGGDSAPKIAICEATQNSIHGFGISGASLPSLADCVSTGNTVCGFALGDNSTATLDGCLAANNSANGFQVTESAGPCLTDCVSTANNWSGVAIAHYSATRLTNLTAEGNLAHGVQVQDSATPVIANSSSAQNGWSGIAAGFSSGPVVRDCAFKGNNQSGFAIFDRSTIAILNCTASGNGMDGLSVLDDARPTLEGLYLLENGGKNVWISSTVPLDLANSTLAGGCPQDLLLSNSSVLSLLDTTCTIPALVQNSARLLVRWYLSFTVLDRSRNPVAGAIVEGTGENGSRMERAVSGPDGVVADMLATEFVQNASGSAVELSHHGPYELSVTKDGETNTTGGIPARRGFSARLYFDFAPRLAALPETPVTEDSPTVLDLDPYLSDGDDPLSSLGISTDREYAVADNGTRRLTITFPHHLPSDVVTVTVSDGLREASRPLNLSVETVNDRPLCCLPVPDLEVVEDQTLVIDLTDHFTDEESGRDLTFTSSRDELSVDNDSRRAFWRPGEGNSSLWGVTLSAFDGELFGTSNPFNITFVPVNDPPVYLGGLGDASVPEHMNWTVDLDECFLDEEDQEDLVLTSNVPEIVIDPVTHVARWSPSGNSSFAIEARISARDPQNHSMVAESNPFTLTYVPVNDPPLYLGRLQDAHLAAGEEWNITLEDYFRDDDTASPRFTASNPAVTIIRLPDMRHCAVWRPGDQGGRIENLYFTAYDGDTYTRSDAITLVADRRAEPGLPEMVTSVIERIPWYLYALLPAGIAAGVAAFYSYRRVRYGKYHIEQAFLVYRDGRLIAHRSRKDMGAGTEDVISGMLTALQGFIRESLQDETKGELDEMKYGDLKIAIERGKRVYLAVFLSGYITERLRSDMKRLLGKVDHRFHGVLESWDGTVDKLSGVKPLLETLFSERKKPARRARPGIPAAPAPAPAAAGTTAAKTPATKKMLQKVVSQMAREPGERVVLKGELEFYQGFVRLKVAARNGLDSLVSDASFKLVYDPKVLRLDRVEPDYELRGDEVVLGNIESNEKKTVAFYLDPKTCTESHLEGVLSYKDVQKGLETVTLPRKLASVVCPVFYTDENINTAMLKRLCESELDRRDTKVFRLPEGVAPARAFELGKSAIKHHDVRLVREFAEPEPYRAEAWFYGKVKGRDDRMVARVRVLPDRNALEFMAASSSKLMLTGLLAELRTDLALEMRAENVEGEPVQVTDAEQARAISSERAILDGTADDEEE